MNHITVRKEGNNKIVRKESKSPLGIANLAPEITYLRKDSLMNALEDLAKKVDPAAFEAKFGAPINQLSETLENSSPVTNDLLSHVNNTQNDIESTITNSSVTKFLINSTPRFFVTLLPKEFEASLLLLQYKLENSQ